MKMKVSSLLVLLTLGFEFAICQAKDYYKTLGLSDSASVAEVKKAFRQMAKTLHPDKCKEEGAEARFREILEAYEVLSDEDKKRQYDRHRKGPKTGSNSHNFGGGTRAQDFNFDFSELFRQFEEDIFNAGPNKESKKDHYRSHFGSHFKNHAKQSGGFFEMDDFFHVSRNLPLTNIAMNYMLER